MSIPFVLTTSPLIPCLRRVPFDATKRNQKSPLGAGPSICIARIASRVAPDLLPCQPRRNIGPRRWTEPRALLRESSRKAFRAYLHWFSVCEELSPKTGSRYMRWRCQFHLFSVPLVFPQFPCLRRVPFDATKRNQKSPLRRGRGKNRPRAERRSFWSFFLGCQEKGRRKTQKPLVGMSANTGRYRHARLA